MAGAVAWAMPASAVVVVNVNGNDNPYLAGHPNGTNCCGGDNVPGHAPTLALSGLVGGEMLTFSAVGGFNFSGGTPAASADGTGGLANMTASYGTGISGAQQIRFNGLVGVFLGDSTPGGTAPAQRADGVDFASIAPELHQIFWIGDGLTGTGTGDVQQFIVPTGATRLFLGSTDGSGWFNNSGTSVVTITGFDGPSAVPEPATWAMMIGGFGLVGGAMRKRNADFASSHA